MKFLSVLFVLLTFQLNAQVNFTKSDSWEKVLAEAKKEGKMIFVDVFTDWCGPCKVMDKDVFPDKKLGEFYNSNFVNFKANATKGKTQEYFNDKYDIIGYPSFLVFDHEGKLLHRRVAGGEVSHMIDFAKDAINPEMRYSYFVENFEKQKADVKFRKNHLIAKSSVGTVSTEDVNSFFQLIPKENWSDKAYWKAFSYSNYNMDSEIAKYLISNFDKFLNQNNAAEVFDTAERIIDYEFQRLRAEEVFDMNKYENLLNLIENTPYSYKKFEFELTNTSFHKDSKKYAELSKEFLRNPVFFTNQNLMNSIAWKIFENSKTDKEMLNLARQLVEMSLREEKHAYNTDTYAQILYFLGNKPKAIELQKEAISLAETEEDKKEFRKTLEKIENGTLE
jgi:thiol-disulfide isomerase/thioredoxin